MSGEPVKPLLLQLSPESPDSIDAAEDSLLEGKHLLPGILHVLGWSNNHGFCQCLHPPETLLLYLPVDSKTTLVLVTTLVITISRVHRIEPVVEGRHDVGLVVIAIYLEGVGDRPTEDLDSCPDVLGLVAMAV